MHPRVDQLRFFLGGRDLEMVTIRKLLEQHVPGQFEDDGLSWGAKASAYRDRIMQALATGRIVVLVELEDDLGLLAADSQRPAVDPTVVKVDHHGELAGRNRPTALEQVFQLLQLPTSAWTRWHELVAANDRGHVRAMLESGATQQELQAVRAADRSAQGITADQEAAGRQATERAEILLDGSLTLVHLPHDRTATVTDVLDQNLGGPGFENLLVLCPESAMFFGSGQAIEALRAAFPNGFYGGDLPERGFWGLATAKNQHELLSVLQPALLPTGANQ